MKHRCSQGTNNPEIKIIWIGMEKREGKKELEIGTRTRPLRKNEGIFLILYFYSFFFFKIFFYLVLLFFYSLFFNSLLSKESRGKGLNPAGADF